MRRFARGVVIALAWVVLVVGIAFLAARQLGVTQITAVAFLVGIPYAAVPVGIAFVALLAVRSRVSAVVAGVLTAVLLAIQVPMFVANSSDASGPQLKVLTVNVAHGDADAAAIVDAVRSNDIDVLAVQELTQAETDDLTDAGLTDLLPYDFAVPLPVADGTGLWSKTPLTDGTRLDGFGFVPVQANTVVDGTALTLVSFHAMSPATPRHTVEWDADLARIRTLMDGYADTAIIAGDFNATNDHRQFRDVASDGFVDAGEAAGAGLFRTFPSDRPLARLDHVVTSDTVAARDVRPIAIPGSDHLGVVATLQLP